MQSLKGRICIISMRNYERGNCETVLGLQLHHVVVWFQRIPDSVVRDDGYIISVSHIIFICRSYIKKSNGPKLADPSVAAFSP